jgi:hypothetical protein
LVAIKPAFYLIFSRYTNLTLTSCILLGKPAGTLLRLSSGFIQVSDCLISGYYSSVIEITNLNKPSILFMFGLLFFNNSAANGSCIRVRLSKGLLIVFNSTFLLNRASSFGGAIFHSSPSDTKHYIWMIFGLAFLSNIAFEKGGGAVYWEGLPPSGISQCLFFNNSAPYGDNLASQPLYVLLEKDSLTKHHFSDFISGESIQENLQFHLKDYYNQTVTTQSEYQVKIYFENPDKNSTIKEQYLGTS